MLIYFILLTMCIIGLVFTLLLLTVDFPHCWDSAISLKKLKEKRKSEN